MMKRMITVLLALLLIAGLFAACGGEKDDDTQPAVTLPTVDAPAGNGSGDPTAQEQGTKPVSTDDPFAETKDWMPGQPTEASGEDPTIPPFTEARPGETQPSSQPAPTETDPTDPAPSEAVPTYDDSDEDIPVTSTAYLDDTDEDLG